MPESDLAPIPLTKGTFLGVRAAVKPHCHFLFLHRILSQVLILLPAPFRKISLEATDKELVTKMVNSVFG